MTAYRIVTFRRADPVWATQMHRIRWRVFDQRLGWAVVSEDGLEADRYDGFHPVYLGVVDDAETLAACTRLLPTTGPTMIANEFKHLLGGNPAPQSATIWESSRFAVDTQRARNSRPGSLRPETHALLAGMCAWGLAERLTGFVTVTSPGMERILARAGWPLRRIGQVERIGKARAVAGMFTVDHQTLEQLRNPYVDWPAVWRSSGSEGAARIAIGRGAC